jgi:translocation and assembly module TamA
MDGLATQRLTLLALMMTVLAGIPLAAHADEPKARIQGVEDKDLSEQLRLAIGRAEQPAESRFEARRRGQDALVTVTAVLRSEGYYGSDVTAELADQDDDSSEAAPRAIIKVSPGPRFRIIRPQIDWAEPPPAAAVQAAGSLAMALRRGAAGRAQEVLAAEGRILSAIQQRGHADAIILPRVVTVDHAASSLQPTFHLEAGPLVTLDGIELSYEGRTRTDWIQSLKPWKSGEVYSPDALAELERRLRETGAFENVAVALAPAEANNPDGDRPVHLSLKDRSARSLEVSAGYSTSEGVGLDVTATRYNGWRRADTRTIALRLAEIQQRLDYRVALPHWGLPRQTLSVTASVYNELTDAYDQTGVGLTADVTQRTGINAYLTYGASIDSGRVAEILKVNSVVQRGVDRNLTNFSLLGSWALDNSDDPLNPKTGWRASVRAEPTLTFGDAQLTYLKAQAQGSLYLPLDSDQRLVLATRLKLGMISGASATDVPAARRFYAGGGGSVRGYAYQAIGPRLSTTPIGGISVAEGSAELRYDLSKTWGLAAFVDLGGVGSDRFPGGDDFSAGVGFGVRYNLGFGPIRADIAVPLDPRDDDPPVQIYISIGQAF